MSCIIFSHGFSFDRNFWTKLASKFYNSKIIIIDYGYFCDNGLFIFENGLLSSINNDTLAKIIKNTTNLYGIGHSLGFAKLLMHPTINSLRFCKFISLAGFAKFNNSNVTSQNIIRMIDLCKKKKNFLPSFYKMCETSYVSHYNNINYSLLIQDLELLYKIDVSDKIQHYQDKILHLIDNDDKILDMKNLNDKIKSINIPNSGHGIGFNNANLCYNAILDFISE